MAITQVSEGMSNQYLVHGIGVFVLAFGMSWVSLFISIPLFIFALGLFISKNGVLVDTENCQYKNYWTLFEYKIGAWKSLSEVNQVVLVLSTEQHTLKGIIPGAMPLGRSSTVQVRTYDLLIKNGIDTVQVNDFLSYKNARKAFVAFTDTLGIDGRDLIAEKLASNRAKRSR